MKKCTGNNTWEWGPDAIFEEACKHCGAVVEFFKDDVYRYCPKCSKKIMNSRGDYGCGQWCSSKSGHVRNFCSKFRKSKSRYFGNVV